MNLLCMVGVTEARAGDATSCGLTLNELERLMGDCCCCCFVLFWCCLFDVFCRSGNPRLGIDS